LKHLNHSTRVRSASIPNIFSGSNQIQLKSESLKKRKNSNSESIPVDDIEDYKQKEIDKLVKKRLNKKVDSEKYPHLSDSTDPALRPYLKKRDADFFKALKLDGNKNISLKNFTIERIIGKGSFGKVYLVISKFSKSDCFALKALKKDLVLRNNEVLSAFVERDVYALGNENPYIARLYASFQNEVRKNVF
jgi:hypothetical protein